MNNNNKKDNRKREMPEEYDNQKSNERHSREKKNYDLCWKFFYILCCLATTKRELPVSFDLQPDNATIHHLSYSLHSKKLYLFFRSQASKPHQPQKIQISVFSSNAKLFFFSPFTVCCSSLTDNKKKKSIALVVQ